MQGVTPPEEIADAWNTPQAVPHEGQVGASPICRRARGSTTRELVSDASASKASKTITDYWFANCQ